MRLPHFNMLAAVLFAIVSPIIGCGRKESDSHGRADEPRSGGRFKEGSGIILPHKTWNILGVKVADVTKRKLADQIRFIAQGAP